MARLFESWRKRSNGTATASAAADDAPRPAFMRQLLHVAHICALGIRRSQLTRMAAALTYRTIFGLIPVIVISLVVLAAFGSHETVGNAVHSLLRFTGLNLVVVEGVQAAGPAPDVPSDFVGPVLASGSTSTHLDSWISSLVDRIHNLPFKAIGFVGVLTLIYASISMLVEIEMAFNQIYNAPTGRSWMRRIVQYWAILTLGTVFLFASFSVTERAMDWISQISTAAVERFVGPHDPVEDQTLDAALVPEASAADGSPEPPRPVVHRSNVSRTLVALVGFAASVTISTMLFLGVYMTVPNTRVQLTAALSGAVLGATLWEIGKWGFTTYLKYSTSYSQLYGTIALLPLFLLWVYVTWIIVLFGLQVAYAMQSYRTATASGFTDSVFVALGLMAEKESAKPLRMIDPAAMVLVMSAVAERFRQGQTTDRAHIVDRCCLDERLVVQILEKLTLAGMLHRVTNDTEDAFVLARPPELVTLNEIVALAAGPRDEVRSAPALRLLDAIAQARESALAGKTLADAF